MSDQRLIGPKAIQIWGTTNRMQLTWPRRADEKPRRVLVTLDDGQTLTWDNELATFVIVIDAPQRREALQ